MVNGGIKGVTVVAGLSCQGVWVICVESGMNSGWPLGYMASQMPI